MIKTLFENEKVDGCFDICNWAIPFRIECGSFYMEIQIGPLIISYYW